MAAKTVVFGLDGACFGLIEPWLDADALPTLAGLIEAGDSSTLESCVPATTPPAWTSLTTGVNPGKHGVFGFYQRTPGSYDLPPVTDRSVSARRLWDYTSTTGLTSLVVNVPVTHPARETEGALVPGYLAPDQPVTYPRSILAELGIEDYRVYAPSEADDVPDEQLLSEWLALTDSRQDAALALMDAYNWDLLFVEFQKTDGAVHKFDERQKVRKIYERVDKCIRAILNAIETDPNVFVVSDHGIGQQKKWAIALNTWLSQQGYVATTRGQNPDTSWLAQAMTSETRNDGLADDGSVGDMKSSSKATNGLSIGQLLGILGRVGITKQRLERLLSTFGLYEMAVQYAPKGAGESLTQEVVDRQTSKAFYEGLGFSGVDVGIVINDERIYPDGTVEEANYDAVRQELIDSLSAMRGPDGEHTFSQVRTREEVYEGARVEEAPDIILEQAPDYVIGSQHPRGKAFIPTDRLDHTREGLLIAAGPDIKSDWSLDGTPHIADITPTLLHLLDVPLNERFDGQTLDILSINREPQVSEYETLNLESAAAVDDDERAAMRDRLKAMGYLE